MARITLLTALFGALPLRKPDELLTRISQMQLSLMA